MTSQVDPALDDAALRPALELGFAVALVLSRQRPAVPVPAALRPFLRFQKLPPAALVPLRRVLEADDEFRARVAAIADPDVVGAASWLWLARPDGWELAAERAVDASTGGAAQSALDGLDATDGAAATAATTEAAPVRRAVRRATPQQDGAPTASAGGERRLARRLEAAEQALVRSRLEADDLRAQLSAVTAKRDDAAAAVPKLTAKVTQLETELRGARRRIDELLAAAEASEVSDRSTGPGADTERAALQAELEAACRERDGAMAALAQERARAEQLHAAVEVLERASAAPSTPGVGDAGTGELPGLLREVGDVTRRLGSVLDRLGSALAPDGEAGPAAAEGQRTAAIAPDGAERRPVARAAPSSSRPAEPSSSRPPARPPAPSSSRPPAPSSSRPPAPRRRPLTLPGGVLAGSVEAAEHLLRQDALVLVDGYNVAKLGWPALPLGDQRARLLGALHELEARTGADLRVVFDGSVVLPGRSAGRTRQRVRVVFSPEGVPADDVVVELAQEAPAARAVVVVTNDQELQARVRAEGANVVGSDQLLAAARR